MISPFATSLFLALAVFLATFTWSIHRFGRMLRYVAPMFEAPRMRWDVRRGAVVLEGLWNGVPVRIRSYYLRPGRLSVTMRVSTRPLVLDARANRSGKMEFRSLRYDRIGMRVLAHVVEDELSQPGPPVRAEIPAYFSRVRLECVRALLFELGWQRFLRNQEGIGVSRLGVAFVRWKPDHARDQVSRTLVELQRMAV